MFKHEIYKNICNLPKNNRFFVVFKKNKEKKADFIVWKCQKSGALKFVFVEENCGFLSVYQKRIKDKN
jgi:hypothetical protein